MRPLVKIIYHLLLLLLSLITIITVITIKEPCLQDYVSRTSIETVGSSVAESYLIYDIAKGLSRHIVCPIILPSKHKKVKTSLIIEKITVTEILL